MKRCSWCGGPCANFSATCSDCADLEDELRAPERLPMRADEAEAGLLELEDELRRDADDA